MANPLEALKKAFDAFTSGVGKYGAFGTEGQKQLTGTPGKFEQVPSFTKQQEKIMQQLANMGLTNLQQNLPRYLGTPQQYDFAPIAEQALSEFAQKGLPSLAERFNAFGGYGSSGFRNAGIEAEKNLKKDLAAQQSKFNLAAGSNINQNQMIQQQLLSMLLSMGLRSPFENAYQQQSGGILGNLAQGAGMAGGLAAKQYLGGLF